MGTHFPMLTFLEDATDSYTNYRIFVEHLPDGSINYPYKLEQGISHQNVALDILRNQGFRSSILDQATEIVNSQHQEKETTHPFEIVH